MNIYKRKTFWILLLGTMLYIFQENIYNEFVSYKSLELRKSYIVKDKKLINYIDSNSGNYRNPGIREIIKISLQLTADQLSFSTTKNYNDPNKLINSRSAHCVGYASFFTATCNYLLKKYGLSEMWIAEHQIGQLFILKENIHQYLHSPFFKDHDFVTIENKLTGELIAVDPSLYDYSFIETIAIQKRAKN